MGMNQELASMYGTPGTATPEDQTKVAEAELFAKLAAENGINLNELADGQIEQLWNATFAKQAEEEVPPSEEEKKKEEAKKDEEAKTAAAQAEFQKSHEWNEKVAECDKLGRIMAHAYVQELGLIDRAMKKQADEMPPQFAAAASSEEKPKEEGEKKDEDKEEKKEEAKEEKEASAIDQLAAKQAVKLAQEAGIDAKVAAKRVDAVLTLGGPGPSEKTASARTLQETVHIRALEFLETAGYQVNWSK